MSLEKNIKDIITKKLEDGTVEKLVSEQIEKGVNEALKSLFASYGSVTKVIEEKLKSVITPYLENYDYSSYIVKLDDVLTEVLKESTSENRMLFNNFKELMASNEGKETSIESLFDKYIKYVSEEVNTDDLKVNYDEGVSYESVLVKYEIEMSEVRSWSSYDYATLTFTCEHDEELNYCVRLSKWNKNESWDISYDRSPEIKSLRNLSEFELLLMRLSQNRVKLKFESTYEEDYVTPEKEPEASFS